MHKYYDISIRKNSFIVLGIRSYSYFCIFVVDINNDANVVVNLQKKIDEGWKMVRQLGWKETRLSYCINVYCGWLGK